MSEKPKIKVLFVDDETNVLDGLQRGLRSMREEWEMTFIDDPRKAIQRLEEEPFDIVVTDMQMPEVSGLDVLIRVREINDKTCRLILSGEMPAHLSPSAQEVAHVCIRKPCSPKQLIKEINRILP